MHHCEQFFRPVIKIPILLTDCLVSINGIHYLRKPSIQLMNILIGLMFLENLTILIKLRNLWLSVMRFMVEIIRRFQMEK